MTPRTHPSPRGMTLVELMVTMVILAIVMAGTMQTLTGFQQLYATSTIKRQASSAGRVGISFIERDLRRAGLGIEPGLALDFSVYEGFEADATPGDGNVPAPVFSARCDSAGAAASECLKTRDRTDGPDELVFYARDPSYWGLDLDGAPYGRAWKVEAATSSSLTLGGHGEDYLGKGQILQVVCSRGAKVTYVTVDRTVKNATAASFSVTLAGKAKGDPYSQPELLGTGCLTTGARAFAVDRFRYHIRDLHMVEATTTGAVPFLVLDRGVDLNDDDTLDYRDLIPVAAGAVDLQVAYVVPTGLPPTPPARVASTAALAPCFYGSADANWTIANAPVGACKDGLRVLDFSTIGADRYDRYGYVRAGSAWPSTQKPRNPRAGADAANVTAVEVHLVTRSLVPARNQRPETPPSRLNRAAIAAPGPASTPWVYSTVQTTIPVPNLASGSISFL